MLLICINEFRWLPHCLAWIVTCPPVLRLFFADLCTLAFVSRWCGTWVNVDIDRYFVTLVYNHSWRWLWSQPSFLIGGHLLLLLHLTSIICTPFLVTILSLHPQILRRVRRSSLWHKIEDTFGFLLLFCGNFTRPPSRQSCYGTGPSTARVTLLLKIIIIGLLVRAMLALILLMDGGRL